MTDALAALGFADPDAFELDSVASAMGEARQQGGLQAGHDLLVEFAHHQEMAWILVDLGERGLIGAECRELSLGAQIIVGEQ